MEDKLCIHCFISGRVQGVFYRSSTKRKARQMKLTGWVKNLADGRVELVACGESKAIAAFHQWLFQGPSGARVTGVTKTVTPWENHDAFVVQR